ncbi:phenylalanine--tRNA ligase subunit beta [Coxiella endosymbiont of Amblyomma americanum]|uniref:phenylalanine--tRNA ligase subunit beta n=1 Tax=Coxiella endosymbiont of Amblyomma americanum TaxID=325775 RepID=UPI00057FAC34|nr:phenylalanine--tRNA ligase subunit beta [Coxiella endosymbiont of Amblyomma americanum]AJC50338.1 phenylalanyl-tRNA synthetase [Coxiella endosymbiont of Amblyomma americanum]
MKLSENWIREWVNPAINAKHLAERLTSFGLEVDSISPVVHSFAGVVIGVVSSVETHPTANYLSFCHVDVGKKTGMLKIICKATNLRIGLKVPVVLIGGRIGDKKIKKIQLRGLSSYGMICSEQELGLSLENRNGLIMELPSNAPVGKNLYDYLQLNDFIFDINLTPNRGDCASVRGVANEIGAIEKISVKIPRIESNIALSPIIGDMVFPVFIEAKEACPHYVGRVIRNINDNTRTSLWMRERLRRSGLRSIHPVVDVTNYIMLELGQPMHAFDLDKLSGKLYVRYANSNENITLIDGTNITLNHHNTLVIADANQVHAIAGVMGGVSAAINKETKNVFLESAYFTPNNIIVTTRHYNLNTDSSYRFERGVDFSLQRFAIERATDLLLAITGGRPGPIEEQVIKETYPTTKIINLRRDRIKCLLGVEISDEEIYQILHSLGMIVKSKTDGWEVKIPSYRFDITQETNLIGEIARLYNYERIPQTILSNKTTMLTLPETKITTSRIRHLMVDRGYNEIVSYSFINNKLQNQFNPNLEYLTLFNPMTIDMNVMRNSLWPGLITAIKHNQSYQITRIKLFEIGNCFIRSKETWQQVAKIAGLITKKAHNLQWGTEERTVDFYDLKGDISSLLSLSRSEKDFRFICAEHPALHPGQSAALYFKEACIGYMGALHPKLVQDLCLTSHLYIFEIELTAITKTQIPHYRCYSKFPIVYRAIAVVVDQDIEVSQIEEEIARSTGDLLIISEVFDIYKKREHIKSGKKSVALRLTLQDPFRTLTDKKIKQAIERVVTALGRKFNAKLREINK